MKSVHALLATLAALRTQRSPQDRGATATEYAVLVAFIALVIVVGVALFGNALNTLYVSITDSLAGLL
jgi:pilus assembly protein Flp/PilA